MAIGKIDEEKKGAEGVGYLGRCALYAAAFTSAKHLIKGRSLRLAESYRGMRNVYLPFSVIT